MIAEKMKGMVANSSAIRAMFEEGNRLAEIYGAENVFDFSLGNPNVPAPEAVKKAIIELVSESDPIVLHGYTNSNSGYADVRETIANSLNERFGTSFEGKSLLLKIIFVVLFDFSPGPSDHNFTEELVSDLLRILAKLCHVKVGSFRDFIELRVKSSEESLNILNAVYCPRLLVLEQINLVFNIACVVIDWRSRNQHHLFATAYLMKLSKTVRITVSKTMSLINEYI